MMAGHLVLALKPRDSNISSGTRDHLLHGFRWLGLSDSPEVWCFLISHKH
jgi:hypothetical protein